jgi:cellobiose PTS system EIIC component
LLSFHGFYCAIVVTFVTYLSMSLGRVPPSTWVAVPWMVPIFINGIMVTNSLEGGLLQLVNFTLVLIILFPFLKFIDRMNLQKEREQGETAKNAS